MQIPKFIHIWILATFCVPGIYARKKGHGDMEQFFDEIGSVMDRLLGNSKTHRVRQVDPLRQRYSMPAASMEESGEAIRNMGGKSKVLYGSEESQRRNGALEFEGYQDLVFRPLYSCDRFDATRRHCVLFRQLGTTLTLGVQVGEGLRRGMRVRWYRYLKKKLFDHFIKETLNRDFLPWNLNLGGSENELRISPITDTDVSYNYFEAELDSPREYRERYEKKPTIRFSIEPIHIDMGSLYHGEEVVLYARSFMELPQTSVNFVWSLYDSKDFEDHGLPSNMRFNSDRSSVIIKELKTIQSQILACSVYSNKDVFLARRNFLFRGPANEDAIPFGDKSSNRQKRSLDNTDQFYEESDQIKPSENENFSNMEKYDSEGVSDIVSEMQNFFQVRVPEISKPLFYNSGREGSYTEDKTRSRLLRSERLPLYTPLYNRFPNSGRRYASRELSGINKLSDSGDMPPIEDNVLIKSRPQAEVLRFEDKESETISTCSTQHDCNIHALCAHSSFSGQNFCKCLHGYSGNGMFCFSN